MLIIVTVFITLCISASLFQFALVLGAPWGKYTMGGKYPGKLPLKMRIAALFQIAFLFLFSFIVLIKSGLAYDQYYYIARIAIWFVVAFFVLGTILNLTTKSKGEKIIWGPVNILLLLLSLLVALFS